MNKRIVLSIIIVSFNTKEILKACLKSLRSGCRDLEGEWETIIVDNHSTDGSREYLKSQNSTPEGGQAKLKIIFNHTNLGFARAVNLGIKKAKGEFILLLNSDIVCEKDSITKLVRFAGSKENLGLVGGRLYFPSGEPQPSTFHLPTIKGAIREFWLGQEGSFGQYLSSGDEPQIVEAVVGALMLIPRTVLEKIGSLDERYFMYFEDLDFCGRLKKANLKVYYYPPAAFTHFHGQSGKKTPAKMNQYLVKSSKIYYGALKHNLINLIIWWGQKWQKAFLKK